MSCVCILTPVVIAAWPAFSAAVVSAAASLGYVVVDETLKQGRSTSAQESNGVQLEIEQSELVTGQLGRDQHISVTRDGVTVTFSRDARGKAALCVNGNGQGADELRALGEQLSQCVVQQYVYQKLKDEMRTRGFVIVEEETDSNRAIRLKVRQWEG